MVPRFVRIVSKGTDILIVRELTGGIYFGAPRALKSDFAANTMVYTADEIRRIARGGVPLGGEATRACDFSG